MDEPDIFPDNDESGNFDSQETICRSRSGTIKTNETSADTSTKNKTHEKRKKIGKYIAYFILGLMIAAGLLAPIIVSVMKKPPTYYVSHRSTSKPVTMPTRTKTTTTGITTKPFDQCDRRFVALTKKMPEYITSVAAADLNNDNKTDIIFIDERSKHFSIIFNLGNDRFADPEYRSTFQKVASMIIADVNDDGNLDVILGLEPEPWDAFVTVFLNIGNGTFYNVVTFTLDIFDMVGSIAATDIDDDGKCDIIIANTNQDNIGVFLNKGGDTFDDIRTYSVGKYPISVIAADLNDDKKADIVVANAKSNSISILFNNGDGNFSDPISYSTSTGPLFVTVADMNNDNKPDIIVVNYFSNNIVIYFNSGSGNFTRKTNFSDVVNPLSVALTDYNSDGSIDIIVPNYHSNNIGVFFNDGHGTFSTPTSYFTYPLPRTVTTADLNDDNKTDIIVGNGNYVAVILTRCY